MYFVPLTSPNLVTVETSPGNSQHISIRQSARRVTGNHFIISCDFDILGAGFLRNTFDHSTNVNRAEAQLKEGGTLLRQLDTITIEGSGSGIFEVEGDITNQVAQVHEVRLRFNARGKTSPVTIGVVDLSLVQGVLHATNDHYAHVNTLTFHTTTNPVPRMNVSIGAIRNKETSGILQRLGGAFAGMAANIFLKPTRVDPEGHAAMLRFGAYLAAGKSSFTFPNAPHLTTRLQTPARAPGRSAGIPDPK